MIHKLVRGQQEEIPAWENTHRQLALQCEAVGHAHLHVFINRQLHFASGGYILEGVAHGRAGTSNGLTEKHGIRILGEVFHGPF